MTGIAHQRPNGEAELTLVCDQCGDALKAPGILARDFAVLWRTVAVVGWRGADRPVGPHFCPTCLSDS